MMQDRWFQGNFQPTSADDPRISAGQIVDTDTDEVLARASRVGMVWGVSYYGRLKERHGGDRTFHHDERLKLVEHFKTIAAEEVAP